MKNHYKKQNGLTLISLLITIILLVVLTTIVLNSIINNKIINTTRNAVVEYSEEVVKEKIQMLLFKYKMDNIETGITLEQYLRDKGYTVTDGEREEIKTIEEGNYIIAINNNTNEIISITKKERAVAINFNNDVTTDGNITATVKLGSKFNTGETKYIFSTVNDEIDISDLENGENLILNDAGELVTGDLKCTSNDQYCLYILVVDEDGNKQQIKSKEIDLSGANVTLETEPNSEKSFILTVKDGGNGENEKYEFYVKDILVATVTKDNEENYNYLFHVNYVEKNLKNTNAPSIIVNTDKMEKQVNCKIKFYNNKQISQERNVNSRTKLYTWTTWNVTENTEKRNVYSETSRKKFKLKRQRPAKNLYSSYSIEDGNLILSGTETYPENVTEAITWDVYATFDDDPSEIEHYTEYHRISRII